MKKAKRLVEILSLLALGSLLFWAIGFKGMDNYPDWYLLIGAAIGAGVAFAFGVNYIICRIVPEAKTYKNAKKVGVLHPLIFIIMALFLGGGRLINEWDNSPNNCRKYKIINKSSSKSNFIFINAEDGTEKLNFGRTYHNKYEIGDSVRICLITGNLGFKYYKPYPTR
jgi:hypothetical protein